MSTPTPEQTAANLNEMADGLYLDGYADYTKTKTIYALLNGRARRMMNDLAEKLEDVK